LAARSVRDAEVAGSNPAFPTGCCSWSAARFVSFLKVGVWRRARFVREEMITHNFRGGAVPCVGCLGVNLQREPRVRVAEAYLGGLDVDSTRNERCRGGPGKRIKWSRHGRVLSAEPGEEFTFVTEEGGRESTKWIYRFEPVDGGTRVTETYDVQWLPAWARIIDGPLNRRGELRRHMRHTLEQLKRAAEAAKATGGPS
jgi:hypothetical protein